MRKVKEEEKGERGEGWGACEKNDEQAIQR